ncbi:MAG TPA: hypothetical protein VNO81_04030 [Candidatus Nitrosotenuis sp.]|jgi:hypothetical protein|nr:hypothetical protein [Candidatus Nitrosotenuis sp.]
MLRTLLLLLWLLLLPAGRPARAAPGDLVSLLEALSAQGQARGVPEHARREPCWLEAWGAVRTIGLEAFLADEGLARIDLDPELEPLRQAQAPALSALDPLLLVQYYARSPGSYFDFRRLVKGRWPLGKPAPDWRSPKTEENLQRVFAVLQELNQRNLNAKYSTQIHRAGWTVSVTGAWYPFQRSVYLFLMATSSGQGAQRVKSVAMNLGGSAEVQAGASGQRAFLVKLKEMTFDLRCRQGELKGEWQDRLQWGGSQVNLSNDLRLNLEGALVQGRLVQTLSRSGAASARLVYEWTGRIENGVLTGTFQATGEGRALQMLAPGLDSVRGSWTGRVDGQEVAGSYAVEGGPTLPWRGRLLPTGE